MQNHRGEAASWSSGTLTSGEYHTLSMLAEATSLSLQEVSWHRSKVARIYICFCILAIYLVEKKPLAHVFKLA